MSAQPNILFIFTDQMRGDSLGCLPGSPVITPNLDRLAREGITFTRCQSNSPLCVPARAVLMTGQLPRENGIWSNRSGADPEGPSHVRNIRDAGYHTAVIGKTHLWRHRGPGAHKHVKEMDQNLESWGFDHRLEINDPIETAWKDCHYTDYLDSKGLLEAHRRFMIDWFKQCRSRAPMPWKQDPAPVPEGDDIDSYVGRESVEWLRSYDREEPFYLQVQFTGPHDPYDGPQRYRDRYEAATIDPGIRSLPHALSPAAQYMHDHKVWMDYPSLANATIEQRRQWRIGYYANITLIDEWIGSILDVLEVKGELDNTWVIFNSDHGEMLGDHGLWSKCNFYRQSMHVPCIVRPAQPAGANLGWHSPALVQQLDIPVTMLDIAGANALDDSLGTSLASYVGLDPDAPEASQGKAAVISELFGLSTVVTDDYKLTVRIDGHSPQELFDLAKDPDELNNVVDDPEYDDTVRSLVAEHLDPLRDRINTAQLADYRDYVKTTGQVN